jgi:NAD(P)-dependent dehydrogenase (short-subunit alcohol dehydrogenase family)
VERRFDGKVVLLTGASRGIGAVTARRFASEGASVVLAARTAEALNEVAGKIEADGGRALAVPSDVGDAATIEGLVVRAVDTFGRLDVAFNNAAGGGQPPTRIPDLPVESFDSAVATTLRSVFLCLKYEIPAMLQTGGGAIVNTSSTAGIEAVGGLAGYVASKHGVIGLTKTAALEYADQGIRVNAVAPGPILTENLNRAPAEARQKAAMSMPMRRVGQPDEVADVVLWLASDAASFVTGITVPIEGGKLVGMAPFAGMGKA